MRSFIITIVFSIFLLPCFSQVNIQDSIALVELYQDTKGDDWVNNTNWLAGGPVSTWNGIILNFDGTRVKEVNLPSNNLCGPIPDSFIFLDSLAVLNVPQNLVTSIPNLNNLFNVQLIDVSFNQLGFGSLEPYFLGPPPLYPFIFDEQGPLGIPQDTVVLIGSELIIPNPVDGDFNMYNWFIDGAGSSAPILSDGSLLLESIQLQDAGEYFCVVTNEVVPLDAIETHFIFVIVAEQDSLGAPVMPRQLIVKYAPGTTPADIDTLLDEFDAVKLDSVLCKDIDLWGLPDSVFLMNGDTLIEIEEIRKSAKAKSKVEEVDLNNIVEDVDACHSESEQVTSTIAQRMNVQSSDTDSVLVAIIDTGIDTSHSDLDGYIWINEIEVVDGSDNDNNCLIDDRVGFNFFDKSPNIFDDNSHGTHIAGTIVDQVDPVNNFRLIGIKTHNKNGRGDIFAMISGIYYASSRNCGIINISSGYTGVASAIMELAIQEAADSSNAVVVCSAGNRGVNNDTTSHYPSSFTLPNVLSVAALNSAEDSIAFFSNFGPLSVDIAAPGTDVVATVPGGLSAAKSGSSMSAAHVSGQLVNIILSNPDLTAEQIVNCVINSAEFVIGLDTLVISDGKFDPANSITCLDNIMPGYRIKVYLQGPFSADTNMMETKLADADTFPLSEPFTDLGYVLTHGIGDTIPLSFLNDTLNGPVAWALIELRDKSDSTTTTFMRPSIVKSSGDVVLPEGDSILAFNTLNQDSFFFLMRFVHQLDMCTSIPYSIDRKHHLFDLTQDTTYSWLSPNIFASTSESVLFLLTGDTNLDQLVNAGDRTNTWNNRNGSGYSIFDVNLDGVVNAKDRTITWNNRNLNGIIPQ